MRHGVAPQISENLGRHPTKALKRLASPLAAARRTVQLELEALLQNPRLIRNRLKIFSARTNARAALRVIEAKGSLDAYLWSFVYPDSVRIRPPPPCQAAGVGFYRSDDTTWVPGQRIAARPHRTGSRRVGRASSCPARECAGVAGRRYELRGD